MRKTTLLISAAALLAGVSVSHATVFAYEGFDSPDLKVAPGTAAPDLTPLDQVSASGSGFTGGWIVSNGAVQDSVYKTAGLDYPAGYPGSHVAVGGSGYNAAIADNSTHSRLRLDLATPFELGYSGTVYVSWLGQRTGPTSTTYANLYPRPAGARLMNGATGNSAMGGIESSGGGGYTADQMTWGAWGWNDTNGLLSGEPSYDGVDQLVLSLNFDTSRVRLWVNPQTDGSSDGYLTFIWTDGDVKDMALYAFGIEANAGDAGDQPRPHAEWAFDEIYVADTFEDAAGFAIPEPSTYAAVIGLLALGLVFYRRRR